MPDDVEKHVLQDFDLVKKLGKYVGVKSASYMVSLRGAYGIVWKAISRSTHQVVALKKCFEAFQSATGMRNNP